MQLDVKPCLGEGPWTYSTDSLHVILGLHLHKKLPAIFPFKQKKTYNAHRYQRRRYYFRLVKDILLSRQQLLETAFSQPPGVLPKVERIPHHPPPRTSPAEQRARRRYFQELAAVRQEVGESDHSSEDDNYPGMSEFLFCLFQFLSPLEIV